MCILIVCILIQNLFNVKVTSCDSSFTTEHEMKYHYTNIWVVRILGNSHKAQSVATQLGFDYIDEVSEGLPNFYLFHNSKYPEVMKYAEENFTKKLCERPEITWAEQQIAHEINPVRQFSRLALHKQKKPTSVVFKSHPRTHKFSFNTTFVGKCLNLNDEHWLKQYYLQNCDDLNENKLPRDLNVVPVWIKHHLFGKNIKVIVVDDGVQTNHSDLIDNYDPTLGLDLQDHDTSPDPVSTEMDTFSHGTNCAGIIAMKANNTICGVGIAPLATLGAVRYLGPKRTTDHKRAQAFLFKHVEAHISSNSWSLADHGKLRWKRWPLTDAALKTGSTKGRGGKGLIYVFPSGSFKEEGENCSCDSIRTSIYTISVASSDFRGKITLFSEQCASIMVTTYSGDGFSFGHNVISTSNIGKDECNTNFGCTSASTPMVSGAIALTLEANLNLTWRDVQHLLAWTSQVAPLQDNLHTWMKNGAGFYVSHDFGFGMLNINELVEEAKYFPSVPPMNTCISQVNLNKKGQSFHAGLEIKIKINGCKGDPAEVMYLEHVQMMVTLKYPVRGDLEIILVSPSGTRANILFPRSFDFFKYGIQSKTTFDSVMTWGESPIGTWTVLITGKNLKCSGFPKNVGTKVWQRSKNPRKQNKAVHEVDNDNCVLFDGTYSGELTELYLIFYGTSGKQKPEHYMKGERSYHKFTLPDE